MAFDSTRRQLLLGMRDHILQTNPRVSLSDAYATPGSPSRPARSIPRSIPCSSSSIGIVESGYDPQAKSPADARGLYQIWPSTGRLLVRSLGWNYDDSTLYDPEKNTEAAALYLDILFSTYRDPQMVLAEYNGGPLNAGFFRAGVGQLAAETRNYVPRVLELYGRLKEEFDKGAFDPQIERRLQDSRREGKILGAGPTAIPGAAAVAGPSPVAGSRVRPPLRERRAARDKVGGGPADQGAFGGRVTLSTKKRMKRGQSRSCCTTIFRAPSAPGHSSLPATETP